jgi:hypothetical protein
VGAFRNFTECRKLRKDQQLQDISESCSFRDKLCQALGIKKPILCKQCGFINRESLKFQLPVRHFTNFISLTLFDAYVYLSHLQYPASCCFYRLYESYIIFLFTIFCLCCALETTLLLYLMWICGSR